MKLSYYNFLVNLPDGRGIIYNTLYKNIVELSLEEVVLYQRLIEKNFVVSDAESLKMISQLKEQLFIIDDGMDELEFFKLEWSRSLYSSSILRHTILPNLACNCDCPYCFESKTGKFMSRQTEEDYIIWLESQLIGIKSLYLTWYGGEPLLSKDTIQRLTKKIDVLRNKYKFEYVASLVTNGVLLDEDFVNQIEKLHIKSVQVTLDGDRDIHNTYRFIKNTGHGTFDTIIRNFNNYCKKTKSDVASILRVNITDDNYASIPTMLERIPNAIKERCVLIFRLVYEHTDGRSPGKMFSEKIKKQSPIANISFLYQRAEEMGFITNSFDEGISYNFCECDFDKSFMIDQDGDLFMCSQSMKKEEAVGNVRFGFASQKDFSRYNRFINTNPFNDNDCLNCKILPICKGGCRKARFIGKKVCSDILFDTTSYILQKYYKCLNLE